MEQGEQRSHDIEEETIESRIRTLAVEMAKAAGDILESRRGHLMSLEYKLRTNFKTQVDDEVDQLLRNMIQEKFPQHAIYSEEQDPYQTPSEYAWIVDPLDGTIPYTYGTNDHYSVSIGVARQEQPFLGIIHAPGRGEFYMAEHGRGASVNGQVIHVSDQQDIHRARLGVDYGKIDRTRILKEMEHLLSDEGITYPLTFGGAASTLGLVASGRLDGYCALKLEPWDMAAAVVLCREACARVTTREGKEWTLDDESLLVANPVLHEKILESLNS